MDYWDGYEVKKSKVTSLAHTGLGSRRCFFRHQEAVNEQMQYRWGKNFVPNVAGYWSCPTACPLHKFFDQINGKHVPREALDLSEMKYSFECLCRSPSTHN